MTHWTLWIGAWAHLVVTEGRVRVKALWRDRDRGSFATDFAIVSGAIILVALGIVAIYQAYADEQANKIGNGP